MDLRGILGVFERKCEHPRIVRNPVIQGLSGVWKASQGERLPDLLSDRPWVRIPPGSLFYLPDSTDLLRKGSRAVGRFFVSGDIIAANTIPTLLANF